MAFTMQAWHWAVLAGVMLILELATPAFFFAWLAAGAFMTAAVAWFFPQLIWQVQAMVFALTAIVAVGAWFLFRPRPETGDHPMLNRRGASLIGVTATLEQPLVNGRGRARLGDTTWPVSGPDLPAGAVVKVVGMDGTRLLVDPVA
jgi:membrane protein implicated in regulation of membrane protease activity